MGEMEVHNCKVLIQTWNGKVLFEEGLWYVKDVLWTLK